MKEWVKYIVKFHGCPLLGPAFFASSLSTARSFQLYYGGVIEKWIV